MFRTSYTKAGLEGLLREGGTGRREALRQTIEGMGGTLEGFYYAFGDCDLYLITELPDDATATAVSLSVGAAGALDVEVTVLVTPETVDEAVSKSVPAGIAAGTQGSVSRTRGTPHRVRGAGIRRPGECVRADAERWGQCNSLWRRLLHLTPGSAS